MTRLGWLGLLLSVLAATSALGARALQEPPGLSKVVKGARAPDVSAALATAGVAEGCKDALRQADLFGLTCRSAVAAAIVHARPLEQAAALTARLALATELARAADAVVAYTPLTPPPGFARARFEALATIGRALMTGHDQLAALPANHPLAPKASAALAARPGPKQAACGVVQRALDAAGPAGVSLDESGALLGLVTSHRCLVDEAALVSRPKPVALQDNQEAKRLAEASSGATAISDYASSRRLELDRCKKHLDAAGRPTDEEKARACLCGVMARWRFPARAANTAAELPFERASIAVQLDAAGVVSQCGPLRLAP